MGKYRRQHITLTGIFGGIAVIIGAFGAHALKPHLSEYGIDIYNTGVSYHFYHSLGMGLTSVLYALYKSKWYHRAFLCFMTGIILFSGSLYILALEDTMDLEVAGFVGPVTPIGGLFFIIGWGMIIWGGFVSSGTSRQR